MSKIDEKKPNLNNSWSKYSCNRKAATTTGTEWKIL